MSNERPNPDQLLAEVQSADAKKHRGRLKVFFGMAAGVGKTYAMLEEAQARAAEGLDVLIAYAEPHIRSDTEALLLGLEILPYKIIEYRNAQLKELDLDAAIARKPSLVIVDELAHTNAPGMRHPKRWQDVAELLDAGINVYSTLNVQHLESVNDIVERISGVRVRETLPDSVLEQADEVELVDIAPEELLERFREGKVYRPDQAALATRHFFTKGNLLALRELALRTTAQRVDVQMRDARREAGIQAAWAATERVLVCVSPSPMSPRLVRSARRLARSLQAEWIAAYVEAPGGSTLSADDRRRVEDTQRLADELGATTVTLSGQNVADELVAYAQRHNVTKIVIGKPLKSRWHDLLFGSVVDDLVRASGEIDIHVIRGSADEVTPASSATPPASSRKWREFAIAGAITAIITAIGWPLYHTLGASSQNVLMLFLLGVLWTATHYSRSAAVVASVLAVLAYDLIFVPPYFTLAVSDRQYIVTFGVMLLTALIISTLTHRVRVQAETARKRERRTASLLSLSKDLAVARTTEDIAIAAVRHVGDALGERAAVLLADADRRLIVKADSRPGSGSLDLKESGVAQWAFDHDQPAGRRTNTLPATEGTYLPLKGSGGTVGVLGLLAGFHSDWSPEAKQLAEALAAQTALAVERTALAEEARAAWERVEAEFLRNTLLSGVSHELRTPLAAITGAASALADFSGTMSAESRGDLLGTVITEAEHMERLITNLLDMTRLESGGLVLKREWQPLQDLIGSALRMLQQRLSGREVTVRLQPGLPLLYIDGVAIEQVLTDLLDNAVEYTPARTPIELTASTTDQAVMIEVVDHGPGLPAGTERRIFEKFFRVHPNTGHRGIGLGLAISRGIIEAHGGTISARNHPQGGAVFTIVLPGARRPPTVDQDA